MGTRTILKRDPRKLGISEKGQAWKGKYRGDEE
jgi:hypothetical protein